MVQFQLSANDLARADEVLQDALGELPDLTHDQVIACQRVIEVITSEFVAGDSITVIDQ